MVLHNPDDLAISFGEAGIVERLAVEGRAQQAHWRHWCSELEDDGLDNGFVRDVVPV